MPGKKSYLDEELLEVAVGFVTNGDNIPREAKDRVQMAISLDNRNHLLDMSERMHLVEGHFLHKLTPKRLFALGGAFVGISSIYIEESRRFLIELAVTLLSAQ